MAFSFFMPEGPDDRWKLVQWFGGISLLSFVALCIQGFRAAADERKADIDRTQLRNAIARIERQTRFNFGETVAESRDVLIAAKELLQTGGNAPRELVTEIDCRYQWGGNGEVHLVIKNVGGQSAIFEAFISIVNGSPASYQANDAFKPQRARWNHPTNGSVRIARDQSFEILIAKHDNTIDPEDPQPYRPWTIFGEESETIFDVRSDRESLVVRLRISADPDLAIGSIDDEICLMANGMIGPRLDDSNRDTVLQAEADYIRARSEAVQGFLDADKS